MTLVEHIRELRTRLFRASIAVLIGFAIGFYFSQKLFDFIQIPYCDLNLSGDGKCAFLQLSATDGVMIKLKLSLWAGLVVSAPVWLYQLWAFIAPGLHKHERRWAYAFGGIAGPLFILGATLAGAVLPKSLHFILEFGVTTPQALEVTSYISFVTNLVLLFGLSFEFPVLLLLLNFAGVATGKRMLGWWRVVIFVCFAFAAIVTPDPSPFGMTLLATCLSLLYFLAVAVALINDKRRARKRSKEYGDLDDDEVSELDYHPDKIEASEPIAAPAPVQAPTPVEERRDRWDDMT
ncbi:twin-arginine translocase subunit TatC [Hamadaea tsunoensis]|uniref:twin-arginine translocase subunit TatC n=1 Tax=Hamadaea tsunoensis TaxID=53368 RepID=UPI0003FF8131|nr:twin-arginine translocase subunit TatC [Hamadaea tsunoensis]